MKINTHPKVAEKYESYPEGVQDKMVFLRNLIIETAKEMPEIDVLEETLKWRESSFLTQIGSTLRIDWKENTPHQYQLYFQYQYQLYFQCKSRLVETFKLIFRYVFEYEKTEQSFFNLTKKFQYKN